jgi:hypothetical protein
MTLLWESYLKTANFEPLCPTFAENRFYEGAYSADSQDDSGAKTPCA